MSKKKCPKGQEEMPNSQNSADIQNTETTETVEPTIENKAETEDSASEPSTDTAPLHSEEDYQALLEEVNELKDKYLRLSAEFDNFRKRTLREKQELISSAASKTLLHLLPVVDDFDRAVEHAAGTDNVKALSEGLSIIQKSLSKFLQENGVAEIDAVGQDLDTDYHDAISKISAPSDELKGKIAGVVRKGYTLNGVVIRHAQVLIGE